jgi:hypothetical protein
MLNTTNPHCFTYTTDELLIELLGGVRVDTLDRMRVTIKVTIVSRKHKEHLNSEELAGLSVRHNLDLYNDTQVYNPVKLTYPYRSKLTYLFAGELLNFQRSNN